MKDFYITWIHLRGTFQILDIFSPASLAPIHVTRDREHLRVIRQGASRNRQLRTGPVVIEITVIIHPSGGEMGFPPVGSQFQRLFHRFICLLEAASAVIKSCVIELLISVHQFAVSEQKCRIACDSLLQKAGSLVKVSPLA